MAKQVEAGDGLAKRLMEESQQQQAERKFKETMMDAIPPTLLQRLQAVREKITYIQKKELAGVNAPYRSAVSHEDLLHKIRATMVEQGILWFPIKTQVLRSERYARMDEAGRERVQYFVEMLITTRFCRTEAKEGTWLSGQDFLDIPVLVHGLDSQDKGPGKASTYADKIALLRVLNLESGDDPDFDERDILPEMSDERAEKILRIRRMASTFENIAGPALEEYISDKVAWYGAKYSRKVATIAGLPDEVLDQWIKALEERKNDTG